MDDAADRSVGIRRFTPAQAQTDDVYPTEDTPFVIFCTGTGGYDGDVWEFRENKHGVPGVWNASCFSWSSDTAEPIPTEPPPPNFLGIAGWSRFLPVSPISKVALRGIGDFACGDGTLTKSPHENSPIIYHQGLGKGGTWQLDDWTAEFTDGVGEISGAATETRDDQVHTRQLSGKVVIDDGAAIDSCDDSQGNSEVVVALILE